MCWHCFAESAARRGSHVAGGVPHISLPAHVKAQLGGRDPRGALAAAVRVRVLAWRCASERRARAGGAAEPRYAYAVPMGHRSTYAYPHACARTDMHFPSGPPFDRCAPRMGLVTERVQARSGTTALLCQRRTRRWYGGAGRRSGASRRARGGGARCVGSSRSLGARCRFGIYFRFQEGYTNAVRRPSTIDSFL